MQLKALRPLTAMTFPAPTSRPMQASTARQSPFPTPCLVTRGYAQAPRPPAPPDEEGELPPPPPVNGRPRPSGNFAPLPPPPPRHHRRRRPAPKPNLLNPTGQVLKVLGGITALVGAWHAAPAVHEHWRKHHKRRADEVIREDIRIELPETGPVHPDMGRNGP